MAIPGFQDFLLPLLQFCADGKGHTASEAADYCYKKLNLTEDDLKVKSDKGTNIAYNRLAWAKTFLTQAKLLAILQRGIFAITQRGRDVLAEKHSELRVKDLKRFDEFMAFYGKKKDDSPSSAVDPAADNKLSPAIDKTPEERIEEAMQELNNALAVALMEQIRKSGPEFFEKIVVRLIAKMGYGDGQQTPYSHDGGIDGVINQDKLGLDAIYLQAKMWDGNVGKPQLQNFAGALEERKASKGIFITSSDFAPSARQYIEKISKRIILINGMDLVKLMIRYNVGVSAREEKTYQIKSIDLDFFDPEG
ncbi:MAG: restriction endonuclease [Lentisphaeria bacterium]|nr:restriction endonuclease [Lentisphaeria bacterium]